MINCNNDNYDYSLIGEWTSDSLSTPDNRWRDFIYIDSSNKFYRTTWWSNKYVIDSSLTIKNDKVFKDNEHLFSIKRIDSNQIELSNNQYYGLFYHSESTKYQKYLNEFIEGDSLKQLFIGLWILDSIQVNNNTEYDYPETYFEQKRQSHFLGKSIDNLKVKVSNNNTLIAIDSTSETSYNFIIRKNTIEMDRSDYILSINYDLTEEQLIMTDTYHSVLTRTLYFKKEKTLLATMAKCNAGCIIAR